MPTATATLSCGRMKRGDYWQFITGTIGARAGAGFEAASQISEYGEIKDVNKLL